MSTDLRGPRARVHTSGPLTGDGPLHPTAEPRQTRVTVPLVVVSSLLMIAWLGEDVVPPVAVAEGVKASIPGASIARLPLDMNPRVERWMEELRTNRRAELQDQLERSGVFAGLIRAELRERAMPEELLYLAMIESGLSPLAESRVSAVGVWQFMDAAARDYGLRMDEYVDERRDPVRATDAALDYLYWLRARFGSWYLAVAAYNAGPGRIERVLELHADGRTGDENIYWEILRHLPRETREYVPRLIATARLAKDADALGFAPSSREPYAYDPVYVPGSTELATVAASLDVDVDVLRDLNPHLIRDVTPPNEMWPLRVPLGNGSEIVASLARD